MTNALTHEWEPIEQDTLDLALELRAMIDDWGVDIFLDASKIAVRLAGAAKRRDAETAPARDKTREKDTARVLRVLREEEICAAAADADQCDDDAKAS